MMKNAAVLALAFGTSLTLWGCSSTANADEVVKAYTDATTAYGKAADKDACKKVTDNEAKKATDLEAKLDKPSDEDKKKVDEAKAAMAAAETACPKSSSGLEVGASSLIDLDVKHQEMGKKRSHNKHSHHELETKPHARMIPE